MKRSIKRALLPTALAPKGPSFSAPPLRMAIALLLLSLATGVSEGAVVTLGDNGSVSAISGLDVLGTQYDVTFTYTGFDALFGPTEPPATVPTFYYNVAGAQAARDAIRNTVNGSVAGWAGHVYLIVPTTDNSTSTVNLEYTHAQFNQTAWDSGTVASFARTSGSSAMGYASFSPAAVPEPSTLALLGVAGASGLVALRRRRRAT